MHKNNILLVLLSMIISLIIFLNTDLKNVLAQDNQSFGESYQFVKKWDGYEDGNLQKSIQFGLDSDNNIFVADWWNHRVR